MIKRTNPIDKNKQELAKELIKIKDKQIEVKEKSIFQLIKIRDKLIDLKANIKNSIWNGLKSRVVILNLIDKSEDFGVDGKKLENLNERSIKEVKQIKSEQEIKSFSKGMVRSNEELIDRLLVLINTTIINFKNEIKEWQSKKKIHLKTFKLGKKIKLDHHPSLV